MKRFWRWKGFLILFIVTTGLALISMYSCNKKNTSPKAPIFEEERGSVIDLPQELKDTAVLYSRDTSGDSQ